MKINKLNHYIMLSIFIAITLSSLSFALVAKEYYKKNLFLTLFPKGTVQSFSISNPDIILFGDSRVYQWTDFSLKESSSNFLIKNFGINGLTTSQALLILEEDIITANPQIVILQLGINDIKGLGVFNDEINSIILDHCINQLKSIINNCIKNDIKVIYIDIFYPDKPGLLRSFLWSSDIPKTITYINDEISKSSQSTEGVYIYKINSWLSKDERIRKEYSSDMLHINKKAYQRLSNDISDLVNKIFEEHNEIQ